MTKAEMTAANRSLSISNAKNSLPARRTAETRDKKLWLPCPTSFGPGVPELCLGSEAKLRCITGVF